MTDQGIVVRDHGKGYLTSGSVNLLLPNGRAASGQARLTLEVTHHAAHLSVGECLTLEGDVTDVIVREGGGVELSRGGLELEVRYTYTIV